MTSRFIDDDALAVDTMPRTASPTDDVPVATAGESTAATERTRADAPFRIHLGRDRHVEVDYRRTAIAAGALGLGVLAFKGVSALLDRRSRYDDRAVAKAQAEPFVLDDGTRTPPAATMPAPIRDAAFVSTDTGAEFVGEPASTQPDTPFVAASDDDDTAGLTVKATKNDTAVNMPVGDSTGVRADRSALTPEHAPTDLMGDAPPGPGERAIDAFRPDATAPVPPEMRDSLRPATGPATGFAGNRGDFAQGLSQADGSK